MTSLKSYCTLAEIQKDILANKITCVQLVEQYLANIKKHANLNAFLEVFQEEALQKAHEVDKKFKTGNYGKLAGMVIGLKDNICYKDHKVSASSKILQGFTSVYNATVVERVLAEDAILIGRCNCDEFAMGSSTENSAYGPTLNPLDTKKVPGGSSGGSAAAIAANLCLASLGTDTSGSIRQPASFCGIVGLKPTYGRVSRYGAIAYASSFDQIGPMTKSVEDAALLLEVIAGKDDFDATISSKEVPAYSKKLDIKNQKFKIAYLHECIYNDGLDKEIKESLIKNIESLKQDGHILSSVKYPYIDYLIPVYQVLSRAEASSNLARYDGVHYGYRSKNATDLDSTYKKSRSEGFGKEVKRRIMLGSFVLSAGFYEAYYEKAQKVRRLMLDALENILKDNDFILLPSTPGTAFDIGKVTDPIKMYLEDIFTVIANMTGHPSISIPTGKHSNNLPFGLQLIAKKFEEDKLLAFSNYVMNNSSFITK